MDRVISEIIDPGEGGRAFDRFYFEGEDYGDRDQNMIKVDDSPYGAVKIACLF